MSDQKSFQRLLKKVQRLKQRDEAWAGTSRLARLWITPDEAPPYRPYTTLFMSDKGKILRSNISEQPLSPDEYFKNLLRTMRRPMLGSGWARRPKTIYLDSREDVDALKPHLASLDIDCQYRASMPGLDDALYMMETRGGKYEPLPGLLSIASITVPLLEQLFSLTAQFYEAKPWQSLDDHYPLEIRYPPDSKPHYPVVMGSGGEVFGLAIYDTLADLELMYQPDLSAQQTVQRASWLVLFFEEAPAMSFDDLDALAQYNWPIAGSQAYPVFGRTTPSHEIIRPTAQDLFWLEGALAGILAFLETHMQLEYGFPAPIEITMPVSTLSGQAELYLKGPAIDEFPLDL